jgi:hypothetical protein
MRKRISLAIALAALLAMPALLSAQSKPATTKAPAISVTLDYFENNSGIFDVKDDKGASVPNPQFGDELKLGWTIVTGKGDLAELKMTHTGTIIKVAQSTNFRLDKLRSDTGGQDLFTMTVGRIRTVAGKASGKDQYRIRTASAVCGVRGSDVVIETLEGTEDKLSTLEGTGWIQNAAGQSLDVAQGFSADAAAATFQVVQIPKDVFDGLLNDMKFTRLDVNETMAINKAWQQSPAPTQGQSTPSSETTPPAPKGNSPLDGIMSALHDILGMEIGSLMINGQTYALVSFEPTFNIGKLKTALYLPIIYQGDMFNSADYYHPLGNNEWSFGTDQGSNVGNILSDLGRDLLLKIKYIEWGRQRDPFYLKVGNLEDITIGHGLIMRDFANDADFPSVRRVGVNVGVDTGGSGFEAMVNDAAVPEIFGVRLFVRPIPNFKMAFGISTIVDWNPGKDWVGGASLIGDPIFINPGIDLDLPFVESDVFGLVMFIDGAVMIPYFRSGFTYNGGAGNVAIPAGFYLKSVYDPNASLPIKNWGAALGFFGNAIIKDLTWRLELRDFTGAFIPEIYSSNYERQRDYFVTQVLGYLSNPTSTQNAQTLGIFGEGGLSLNKLFAFKLGYFWPWAQDSSGFTFANDEFEAEFVLQKGVIPVVNIWGSISYVRMNFVPTILRKGAFGGGNLFDANTLVTARINYPIAETLDISLLYTTTAHRNPDGSLVYPAGSMFPQVDTSVSIITTVHL